MDERQGVDIRQGNAYKVQQPCSEGPHHFFLFNDGKIIQLNTTQQDGRIGRRLAPRVLYGGTATAPPVDKLPVVKVSKNLKPVEPENDVLDLTLSTTEKPANIPNLTIFESAETEEKNSSPEKPTASPVQIAEPYVDIRKRQEKTSSKICQEVSCDQFGISLRVAGCNPLQEFPGLTLNPWSEEDQSFNYDSIKLFTKPKKTVSSVFQKGLVTHGTSTALRQLMDQHKLLVTGTHGIITNEVLNPSQSGRYSGEHFGEYEVVMNLGEGGFGKVQLCVDKFSQKQFVRKEIFNGFKSTEVLLLQQINHQNITKLFGFIQREGRPEIMMEYAGISLLRFTLVPPTCTLIVDDTIWDFTKQGLSALEYLDNRGIIHLDIKPENFCVFDDVTLKLTDFGSAKTPQDQLTFNGWTAEYMSPEACVSFLQNRFPQRFQENSDYQMSGKTDIFSFALTILFMFCKTHVLMKFFTNGASSYKELDRKQTQLQILLALAQKPDIVRELMLPDNCNPQMKELLMDLLQGCPVNRPSAFEALVTMQEIKDRDNVPVAIEDEPQVALKSRAKAKHVKGSRKSSSSRESQNSRYSMDSVMVTSGSLMNSLRMSVDEYSNLGSPVSPGSPESPGGPVRCRALKNKIRQRLSCPYGTSKIDESVSKMIPSNPHVIEGNFPNFAMLND